MCRSYSLSTLILGPDHLDLGCEKGDIFEDLRSKGSLLRARWVRVFLLGQEWKRSKGLCPYSKPPPGASTRNTRATRARRSCSDEPDPPLRQAFRSNYIHFDHCPCRKDPPCRPVSPRTRSIGGASSGRTTAFFHPGPPGTTAPPRPGGPVPAGLYSDECDGY